MAHSLTLSNNAVGIISRTNRRTWSRFLFVLGLLGTCLYLTYWLIATFSPQNTPSFFLGVLIMAGMSVFGVILNEPLVVLIHQAKRIKSPNSETIPENIWQATQAMVEIAGIRMPRMYIMPDTAPNACAFGWGFLGQSGIALTKGLLKNLNQREIIGVIAHEIAHIKHRDIITTSLLASLVGMFGMIADIFLRSSLSNSPQQEDRPEKNKSKKDSALVRLLLIVVVLIFAGIIGKLIGPLLQLWISRNREYAADAYAAFLCNSPKPLIEALSKLEAYSTQVARPNALTATLFFGSTLGNTSDNLLATHPTLKNRIKALQALAS